MFNPLPSSITIKKSPVHGLELFAVQKIPKGTNLGLILYCSLSHKDKEHYRILDGMDFIRTPLGGFGNHSENPNCQKYYAEKGWHLCTTKDINPDEEITWKYTLYNPSINRTTRNTEERPEGEDETTREYNGILFI